MKKKHFFIKVGIFLSFCVLLLLLAGCTASQSQSNMNMTDQGGGYNVEDLNGYGEWVQINGYGQAWYPFASSGWMPFDNGHWAYANTNWTWVSYEPFGWIVYHYGYWFDDPIYGWVWIPSDDIWSPANVMWCNYGDYIGWAPLGPRDVDYGRPWELDHNSYWHVVRTADFTRDNIRDYRVMNPVRTENDRSEIINKQPDRQFVEKTLGRQVPEVNIQHENVKLPERNIERMNLPQQENKRVEQNSPRVRNEVLIPREEFHRQQNQKNNHK